MQRLNPEEQALARILLQKAVQYTSADELGRAFGIEMTDDLQSAFEAVKADYTEEEPQGDEDYRTVDPQVLRDRDAAEKKATSVAYIIKLSERLGLEPVTDAQEADYYKMSINELEYIENMLERQLNARR